MNRNKDGAMGDGAMHEGIMIRWRDGHQWKWFMGEEVTTDSIKSGVVG